MGGGDGLHRGGAVGAHQGVTHLFYDGGCGLCCGAVRFVAKHDRSGLLRFAPLNGETFEHLVPVEARAGLPDSLVVTTPEGALLTQSEAVIHLLLRMGPACRWVGTGLGWIPQALRNPIYRLIARWRPRKRACVFGLALRDNRFDP